jgi:hypothetical protein
MNWTGEKLAKLPLRSGYRLRAEAMARIEVFCDAAFAFAVTMFVISLSSISEYLLELIQAMKGCSHLRKVCHDYGILGSTPKLEPTFWFG